MANSDELLKGNPGDLWDSGKVVSDQSIQVEYAGKLLGSRMACYWQVRVWDKDGKVSAWSKPATFEMGLLEPDAWKAKWIGMAGPEGKRGSPMLRKEVAITGMVGVGTWSTQAEFKDIKVTRGDQVLLKCDFADGTKGWKLNGGDWKVQDGALQQTGGN